MSLLGSQVYANPDTPCWVSASGDTINGDLTVNGSISATGSITSGALGVIAPDDGNGFSVFSGATLKSRFQHITGGTRTLIQSTDPFYFTQVGQANGNTSLTVSAFGSDADVLTVGGEINTNILSTNRLTLPVTGLQPIAGKSFIPVGQDNVTVPTFAILADSIVLITRMGAPTAGPGNGANQGTIVVPASQIVPGTSFEAHLVDPTTGVNVAASLVNAEFCWVIIN